MHVTAFSVEDRGDPDILHLGHSVTDRRRSRSLCFLAECVLEVDALSKWRHQDLFLRFLDWLSKDHLERNISLLLLSLLVHGRSHHVFAVVIINLVFILRHCFNLSLSIFVLFGRIGHFLCWLFLFNRVLRSLERRHKLQVGLHEDNVARSIVGVYSLFKRSIGLLVILLLFGLLLDALQFQFCL